MARRCEAGIAVPWADRIAVREPAEDVGKLDHGD